MVKKQALQAKQISNRRARHDYDLSDGLLVGIVLSGAETKALRRGHGQLRGAYVVIKDSAKGGELMLVNATIHGDKGLPIAEEDKTRSRKLLAKKREINQLISAKQQGQTIVPLEILTRGRYIKVRIAAGRGKKLYDKRQTLKKRDEQRQVNYELKRN